MPATKVKTQTLRCGACGAPFALRAGPRARVIVCAYCDTATDLTDPSHGILWRYQEKIRYEPTIPLGARGTLNGEKLECIGFMRRSIEIDGETFGWSEYLLHNPYKGFRFLVEDEGQWSLVKLVHALPTTRSGKLIAATPPQDPITYYGRKYSHKQTHTARVDYAIGEFHWAVTVGDTATTTDYESRNLRLSAEVTADEITWSAGHRVEARTVLTAFGLQAPDPSPEAPLEAGPYSLGAVWKTYAIYCLLSLIITSGFAMRSKATIVFEQKYTYDTNVAERAFVTPVFTVPGPDPASLEVKVNAGVSNRWAAWHLSLIRDDDGSAQDFGLDASLYSGVEDGESWTEGSQTDVALLSHIAPGRYYLFVEPESGTGETAEPFVPNAPSPGAPLFDYLLTVRSDLTNWGLLVVVDLLLLPVPIWLSWRLLRRNTA